MSSEVVSAPILGNSSESSGTLNAHDDNINSNSQFALDKSSAPTEQSQLTQDGEEQALESHEVIELQEFSERKAWIEEKIKVSAYVH